MPHYEYKVVPAPSRGVKAKGVRTTSARFAHGLEVLMNEAGAEGWEYLRADTLPCDERQGLRGWVAVDQNVLVFRRRIQNEVSAALVSDTKAPAVRAPDPVLATRHGETSAEAAPVVRLGPAIRQADDDAPTDRDMI